LLGLSIVIFVIARVVPGDPVRMALGPRAPQEVVDRMRDEMHLDDSLPVQYLYWLGGAVRGDFGTSLTTWRPVAQDIREYLPVTLELVIFAGLIHSTLGMLLGTLAASKTDSWLDNIIRLVSYVGVVCPSFVWAVLFVLIFGYWWHLLPTMGRMAITLTEPTTVTGFLTVDSLLAGNMKVFFNAIAHMILPAVALAMGPMSQEARITRSSMVENLDKDYIYMSIAQGIPRRSVMRKYLLKPSIIPTVSILGLDFASMVAGAFLIELIFNRPGFARYGITAMLMKDLNAISAVVLTVGIVFMTVNILVDIVVAYLDPRIRLGE